MGTKYFEVRELQYGDIVFMLKATITTVELSVIALIGGLTLGVIVGVCRSSNLRLASIIARLYVELFRGIPILLQIFMFYYGLKIFAIEMPALLSVSIAFVFNVAANVGETLRGIILSIPKSQWEAAACLGLPYVAQLRYAILPQVVRAAIPPSIGIMVGLVKDTSLASIVGFVELTRSGALIMAVTMNPYTAFPLVAVIYFVVCCPLTQTSRWLERRLAR
jgi:polar amino acid transport system permease protein